MTMLLLFLSSVAVRLVSEKSGEYGAKTCSSESFRRCSSDSSGVLESDIIANGAVLRGAVARCHKRRPLWEAYIICGDCRGRQHVSKDYTTIHRKMR